MTKRFWRSGIFILKLDIDRPGADNVNSFHFYSSLSLTRYFESMFENYVQRFVWSNTYTFNLLLNWRVQRWCDRLVLFEGLGALLPKTGHRYISDKIRSVHLLRDSPGISIYGTIILVIFCVVHVIQEGQKSLQILIY